MDKNKDLSLSLSKYLEQLTQRLSSPIPAKHKDRAEQFNAFLQKEIKSVKSKLESLKLQK